LSLNVKDDWTFLCLRKCRNVTMADAHMLLTNERMRERAKRKMGNRETESGQEDRQRSHSAHYGKTHTARERERERDRERERQRERDIERERDR